MWGKKKAPAQKVSKKTAASKTTLKKKTSTKKAEPKVDQVEIAAKEIFDVYATSEDMGRKIIGAEGIGELCTDLKIDMGADLDILVFMYYCDCEEYGQIPWSEFLKGCQKLQVADFNDFKKRVPKALKEPLSDVTRSDFRPFYKFVFKFHREGMNKNVELET